jgi:hypothetical protein
MNRIFAAIGSAILKLTVTVILPAAFLLVKGFVDSMFPSSAREVSENM